MVNITFNDSAKNFVLGAFGKSIKDNFIVEKNNQQRVLDRFGEEIIIDDFAGIKKGSEVFIKSDLVSLMKLCDDLA
jgi:hypothetical protein